MPQLQFYQGDRPLFVTELRSRRTVIGRDDHCDPALLDESVSREHCVVQFEGSLARLVNRSRHGTRVNGERVDESHLLEDGDRIGIGVYTAVYWVAPAPRAEALAPTFVNVMDTSDALELVHADEAHVAAFRCELRIAAGPRAGETIELASMRTTIGGPGSGVELGDPALPRNAIVIRLVRGRALLVPGQAPCTLNGARVLEPTPLLPEDQVRIGEHALRFERPRVELPPREVERLGDLVGGSSVMRRLFGILLRLAAHDHVVLITGESGTGKELAARALHEAGPRREGPFVALNAAALSAQLFESELFGHEKGAFTGADERRDGAFHAAHEGTLFLDEIGELPLPLQAKLLRVLESGEVRRVGSPVAEFPDVRLVLATHRDLPAMVVAGTFRADLYHRLSVLDVHLPSLRERMEDLPILARALLDRYHLGQEILESAIDLLRQWDWPGNVRELRNVLMRAVILADHGGPLRPTDLRIRTDSRPDARRAPAPDSPRAAAREAERRELVELWRACNGVVREMARRSGIPRNTLAYKLEKHGITRNGSDEPER